MAEDAWNTRDPARVALAYSENSRWRNRAEFLQGRPAIEAFLTRKWNRELDYRLIKELWAFHDNRIAVRFAYEWHDDSGSWFRSYGNENWEFDAGRADAGPPGEHQRSADPRAGPPLPLAARPPAGRSSRLERAWALKATASTRPIAADLDCLDPEPFSLWNRREFRGWKRLGFPGRDLRHRIMTYQWVTRELQRKRISLPLAQ